MSYDLLVEIAWKSAVVSGLALLLLLAVLRHRSAAERSWVAHAGMIATLLLPAAILSVPHWEIETYAAIAPPAPIAGDAQSGAPASSPAAAAAQFPAETIPSLNLADAAFGLYATVAGLLLVVMAMAVLRLFALKRRASVLVEQSWLSAMAHAQRRMGFKHGTALLVSDELASPVSWGILRPIILLNEEAAASPDQAEAIIAHELAHVARLDWANLLIARAATALLWFNPLVWLLARQCHQLREEAADDAVLRGNVPNTDYAALLVGAARHESKAMLLAANGVAPHSASLKQRVTRVLDSTIRRNPAQGVWPVASLACTGFGALLVAAVTPVSALSGNPRPDIHERPALAAAAQSIPQEQSQSIAQTAISGARAPASSSTANVQVSAPALQPEEPAENTKRPSIDRLIEMRANGVSAEWLQDLAELGYRNLRDDQMIDLAAHGASPHFIREMAQLGYQGLTVDQLIAMRTHGVSPVQVRKFSAAGYSNLTLDQLLTFRMDGVSPEYVRQLADLGFRNLSPDMLVQLRRNGVTARFVREIAQAGHRDLTPDRLMTMRRQGISSRIAARSRETIAPE